MQIQSVAKAHFHRSTEGRDFHNGGHQTNKHLIPLNEGRNPSVNSTSTKHICLFAVVHINMAFFILFYINLEAQFFLIIAYLEVKAIKLVQLGTLI